MRGANGVNTGDCRASVRRWFTCMETHRTMRYLIVAAAFVAACSDSTTAPLNDEFTLRVGERITIEGANLSLMFKRVTEDSRCGIDAICIWAGNGQVELEARNNGQTAAVFLNTFQGAKEAVVGTYRIALTALFPAPRASTPISPGSYRVSLTVSQTGIVCTEEARPGLMVALADSLTGDQNFTDVSVVARDGAYADSIAQPTYPAPVYGGPIPLAYERKGTYTVTVRAAGYAPWVKTGVVVNGDQCHVVTVPLTARLTH